MSPSRLICPPGRGSGGLGEGSLVAPAHRQQLGLGQVPEALPKMHVQVLRQALELIPPQFGIDGKLPAGEEGPGSHPWGGEQRGDRVGWHLGLPPPKPSSPPPRPSAHPAPCRCACSSPRRRRGRWRWSAGRGGWRERTVGTAPPVTACPPWQPTPVPAQAATLLVAPCPGTSVTPAPCKRSSPPPRRPGTCPHVTVFPCPGTPVAPGTV